MFDIAYLKMIWWIYETVEQKFSYLKYEYINNECKNKFWFQMRLRKK